MKANCFHLGSLATVYDCEMEGIRRAATKLLSMNIHHQQIVIYCDNQSCIRALSRNQTNSRSTWLTHNTLQAVGSSNELVVEWIPGHSNYYGNETADKLANRGCITKFLSAEPILPLRESVINSQIRKWTLSIWQKRWRSQPTCRQTKFWVPSPGTSKPGVALSFDRHKLTMLTGIITGHTRVRKHLFVTGVTQSPNCECGEEESPAHIVGDCPLHVDNRQLHLKQPIIHVSDFPLLDYDSVLSFFMATRVIVGNNSEVSLGTV